MCVTAVKVSNFSGHYLRNHSTLDMGVLGYIGIVQHKEHSPEVLSIPPGTTCIREKHVISVFCIYICFVPRNLLFKIPKAVTIRIFETIRKGPTMIKTLNVQVDLQKKKIPLIGK